MMFICKVSIGAWSKDCLPVESLASFMLRLSPPIIPGEQVRFVLMRDKLQNGYEHLDARHVGH